MSTKTTNKRGTERRCSLSSAIRAATRMSLSSHLTHILMTELSISASSLQEVLSQLCDRRPHFYYVANQTITRLNTFAMHISLLLSRLLSNYKWTVVQWNSQIT